MMLFDPNALRREAGAARFTAGSQMAGSGKVQDLEWEVLNKAGNMDLHADIKGARKKPYHVRIQYNLRNKHITSFECDCPTRRKYYELCEHCTALMLACNDHADEVYEDYMKLNRETPDAVKQLLGRMNLDKVRVIEQARQYVLPEKVRLEPHFAWDGHDFTVDFKIGSTRLYVLKNIYDFEEAVTGKKVIRYGKQLEFVPRRDQFDEEGRIWFDFLVDWVRENVDDRYTVTYNSYSYYPRERSANVRYISLSGRDLDLFFATAEKEPLLYGEVSGFNQTQWKYEAKTFYPGLSIQGFPDGIEVVYTPAAYVEGLVGVYYFTGESIERLDHESYDLVYDFVKAIGESLTKDRIFIGKEDLPVFCTELLPVLENIFRIRKQDFDPAAYGITPVRFEIYLDMEDDESITIKTYAIYGKQKYDIYGPKTDAQKRDLEKELAVENLVSSYATAFDETRGLLVLTPDDDRVFELLSGGVHRLSEVADVFCSDALKRQEVRQAPKVTIGVSIAGNLLELAVSSDDMSMEELSEILSRYNKKKKYYRLKSGDFIDMEDASMQALIELKDGLDVDPSELKQGEKLHLPKYRALYLDGQLRDGSALSAKKSSTYRSLIRNMKTIEDNDFEVPASLADTLREYQTEGFLWQKTLSANGFCGILADEMGLGKTLQVIAYIRSEKEEKEEVTALIISPASLVYNWKHEFEKFAPELSVTMVTGTAAARKEILSSCEKGDILITSYDLLKRDLSAYREKSFDIEVIDEAQFIKNANTKAAKAVKAIGSGFRLALTGTPVENRLSELWSIFDYLMPGFLFDYAKFRDEIETPIVQNNDTEAMTRLQRMIRPFVLRRLKKEVLRDLPDKLEEEYFATMDKKQRKLYDAHVKRLQLMLNKQSDEEFKHAKIQILSELTRLRQLCCDPALIYEDYDGESAKLDLVVDLIGRAVSGGHKILLFSQFTSMLDRITAVLEKEEISYYLLTGSTAKEKRIELVDAFNSDETNVFLISLKAGGTGLNLTAADIVIHFDPWWNVAVQDQATDRAHRIGQKNIVTVYKLLVKDTIEENIQRLQDKKRSLADTILGGEGMSAASFSREEMLELLQ